MIALLQRVLRAKVTVGARQLAAIGAGLTVFVAVEPDDDEDQAKRLAQRVVEYRVFADATGRMNLSVRDIGGAVLLVPQFTLAADTRKGNRPGFSTAARPELGQRLFACVVAQTRSLGVGTETGQFGADMQVALVNDGPATFWLQSSYRR